MANSITTSSVSLSGFNPSVPQGTIEATFVIDTYPAGGVDLATLIDANSEFAAVGIKSDNIYDAKLEIKPDTEGLKYTAIYDKANQKAFLRTYASDVEQSGNPAAPVTIWAIFFVK